MDRVTAPNVLGGEQESEAYNVTLSRIGLLGTPSLVGSIITELGECVQPSEFLSSLCIATVIMVLFPNGNDKVKNAGINEV